MKKSIYIFKDGQLKREANTLCLVTKEGKRFIPVEDISEIHVLGELDLNKRLLEFLTEKEVILHFYNHYGYYAGSYYPRQHLNSGFMIVKQAQHYIDPALRLELARSFVIGAYKNIRQVLLYYERRGKQVVDTITHLEKLGETLDSAATIEQLMAIEGNIRDAYYSSFDTIIGNSEFPFVERSKRPPGNELNALISFGNSLMYTTTLSEIYRTHLDPRIGFLHASNFRRFSLQLDVAEIFKPIIVDRVIFTLVGKRMLKKSDFEKRLNGVVLTQKGRATFVKEFEQKIMTTIKHRDLGREVTYRRLVRMELYKLEKHFMGERKYEPFVARW
ncbi:MAG: CRISP-associated protein Cas1 [Bacillota bacterium]|jgi:CRISPR-associated protein Cas1|nr:CRISP-associated protein Cas1 [Bacillota bacterium]MDK2925163.1 CRISP-associated protein Cas1 [Bacillota bacterium]